MSNDRSTRPIAVPVFTDAWNLGETWGVVVVVGGWSRKIKRPIRCLTNPQQQCLNLPDCTSFSLCFFFFLLGVKSPCPSPTLEGSVQNLELKFCSRATVKCASGTVGAVKVCARTPGVCSCALLKLYCLCVRGWGGGGGGGETD